MNEYPINRTQVFATFIGYLVFVVYGSLIPFELKDLTLEQALDSFIDIQYLDLSVVSRADWIANILLYIPLSFLACLLVGSIQLKSIQYPGYFFVFIFCLFVVVAVEFTQTFFAPRTVSLNDLLAESMGTLGGILTWIFGRRKLMSLWTAFSEGGYQSVIAATAFFGLAYFALGVFPLDFVISTQELMWKFESDRMGWLFADNCSSGLRCIAHNVAEALAIMPLGVLLSFLLLKPKWKQIFLIGIAIGVFFEFIQLFLASGTSQGISVLARGLGLIAGVAAGQALRHFGAVTIAQTLYRFAIFAAIPYLIALVTLNGWFSGTWITISEVIARLPELKFMPLYYHYYSTEPQAVASLMAQVGMYAPLGLVWWIWHIKSRKRTDSLILVALSAAALSFPIELGKLFFPPKHPDLTNPLIAAGGAVLCYWLARWFENLLNDRVHPEQHQPTPTPIRPKIKPLEQSAQKNDTSTHQSNASIEKKPIQLSPLGLLIGSMAGLALLLGLFQHPYTVAVGILVIAYGILLWFKPYIWLLVLPLSLPLLDFSQYTGRLLLDEFDLLVLTSLAISYFRHFSHPTSVWTNKSFLVSVGLLWLSWVVAIALGLLPMLESDSPIHSSHSPIEAWMVGKGLFWALILIPLMRRIPDQFKPLGLTHIFHGLLIGLTVVGLVVLLERHIFVGLFDFSNVFRVTGTFANMHNGGAYIEAFIALAFPALIIWLLTPGQWHRKLIGLMIVPLIIYSMLVTFSRGGYAALLVGLGLVLLCYFKGTKIINYRRAFIVVGVLGAILAIAIPILSGNFAQHRLSRIADDLNIRLAHWAQAIDLSNSGLSTALFGMGFGQYPTQYLYSASFIHPPGTYQILSEDDNPFIRLGAGESVFLDQIISLESNQNYTLTARTRHPLGASTLKIPVCEKALLYSFDCIWNELTPANSDTQWHEVQIEFNSQALGTGGHWPHRTVKLSLHNAGAKNAVDVDNISLTTSVGIELIRNGDFSDKANHWLLVTDQDLAWHIHQQTLEMYFAQGLLGLLAWIALLIASAKALWPPIVRGEPTAIALTAGMIAFLTVGLLGSTMDTAKLSMLFYLIAFSSVVMSRKTRIAT